MVIALTLVAASVQCQPRPIEATFDIVRDVREWGTVISAVVIDLGGRNIGTIDTNTFSVYATHLKVLLFWHRNEVRQKVHPAIPDRALLLYSFAVRKFGD